MSRSSRSRSRARAAGLVPAGSSGIGESTTCSGSRLWSARTDSTTVSRRTRTSAASSSARCARSRVSFRRRSASVRSRRKRLETFDRFATARRVTVAFGAQVVAIGGEPIDTHGHALRDALALGDARLDRLAATGHGLAIAGESLEPGLDVGLARDERGAARGQRARLHFVIAEQTLRLFDAAGDVFERAERGAQRGEDVRSRG